MWHIFEVDFCWRLVVQGHVWTFPVVVFNEFPVELESGVLKVVCSEPSFDFAERGGFADSAEDVLDSDVFTVGVEGGFASAYAPELAAMIGEDLSRFRVFVNSLVE